MSLSEDAREALATAYAQHARRIFATLVRVIGDWDRAEEALQDAFAAAADQWPSKGVPDRPAAWLLMVARNKAVDRLRAVVRQQAKLREWTQQGLATRLVGPATLVEPLPDDQLRLIFTCCHPALPPETHVALTLREVCGLSTEAVADAFLTAPATVAQRIVRGKAKIRQARIPYQVPTQEQLPERLEAVLAVIYLVFNEGYAASRGATLTRFDLSAEAIRLGRLVVELLPEPEAQGLLALMLFHDARREARTGPAGELILLEDQDRGRWDADMIDEASRLLDAAFATQRVGPYMLQAAIAGLHAQAKTAAETDWPQIAALYEVLWRRTHSPIVALNRAVAIAMRDGPEAGLRLMDELLADGQLDGYALAHAARADLLRRLDQRPAAIAAYRRALELERQQPQQRFLEGRLAELAQPR